MASNISTSGAEQFVVERLFSGLLNGSFLQHKELLNMLEDVDVRHARQRTFLHIGVGLGKADWVQELLARGADTDIADESQLNALSSAEEMVRQFPDDEERSKILNLVTLVHRRDQVILRRLDASSSRSADHVTPVASPECDIASLKSSVDSLRREMKSLVRQLSSSLEELKAELCALDTGLRRLEEDVKSTVEDVTSVKFGIGGESDVRTPPPDPATARLECVDAMLRRTAVVYGNGMEVMRRLYERLYDGDECTACIIKFLSGDDRVKVMVDLESENIERMKEKVVDLDGSRVNGSGWCSFCDFESMIIYLGADVSSVNSEKFVCTELAWALSQLSLKLVYDNEWRPYSRGDVGREWEWMRALEEAEEERRKRGWGFDWYVDYALDRRIQSAKLCYLAAVVPRVFTYSKPIEARALLQHRVPLLLSFYTKNVMPALLAKARRCIWPDILWRT
ncbi:uncharacterized protein LOC124172830 isoform X2 [Ischnura elegans]|uniref:uncharacterized protein LOC124172830 isoform X2 n=1 Tax=Ischnura elegans TaxID=197161 RepID=UPI001ED89061|nr:uncharacterized protein LOC124172830 isoform X2 [Ischnura elegans]